MRWLDGLGIEPSRELQELETAILRHEVPVPEPPPSWPAGRLTVALDARRRVTFVCWQLASVEEAAAPDPEALAGVLGQLKETARTVCARSRRHRG